MLHYKYASNVLYFFLDFTELAFDILSPIMLRRIIGEISLFVLYHPAILQFEISSLMNWIYFLVWIAFFCLQ